MNIYRVGVIGLAVMILLAGCIAIGNGGEDEDDETEEVVHGHIIQSFVLEDTAIYEDSDTRATLTLQNPREESLEQVQADIRNHGHMGLVRQVPVRGQSGLPQSRCRFDEIGAGQGLDAPDYRCIWRLEPEDGMVGVAREQAVLPVTAVVTYRSELTASGSVEIQFAASGEIRPGDEQEEMVSETDGEIEVAIWHTSPVRADRGEVPVTIEVRNVGGGSIVGLEEGGRTVDISFGGTLTDTTWDMEETTCVDSDSKEKTLRLGEEGSVSTSCVIVLDEPNLADTSFSLRADVLYRYQYTEESPLTVFRVD